MSSLAVLLNVNEMILPQYQHMMHKIPEGIIFLFSTRFSNSIAATAHNLAMQYRLPTGNVIEELRRLIAIKTFTADEDGTKIMPTNLMDELWVAAIVDTQVYADLQNALGIKLYRRYGVSEPAADQVARALRQATMKCLYKNFFGSEPLGPTYPLLQQVFMAYPPVIELPELVTLNIRL
ncbi:hypothetical protein DL98DRAFT_581543 [Cadophora sp. DSE1049]|nr:hypothetical protein DL98DRAFT_581543 [Cadophora sp. DSE1049]